MADEESAEQKTHTELCEKIDHLLYGYQYSFCLDALAAVAARICAEQDYPEAAALAQIQNMLVYVAQALEEAERVAGTPEQN